MTTADRDSLGDAAEADVAEQRAPIDDAEDGDDTWGDVQRVGADRDWQASEADLIEQTIAVPDEEPDFDR